MLAIESENLQISEEVWDKVFSTVERIRANMTGYLLEDAVCPICGELSLVVRQRDHNKGGRVRAHCINHCFYICE